MLYKITLFIIIALTPALAQAAGKAKLFYITEQRENKKLYLHFVPPDGNWEWKPTSKGAVTFNIKWAKYTVGELSRSGSQRARYEAVK